jgi:hypothetical protein
MYITCCGVIHIEQTFQFSWKAKDRGIYILLLSNNEVRRCDAEETTQRNEPTPELLSFLTIFLEGVEQ